MRCAAGKLDTYLSGKATPVTSPLKLLGEDGTIAAFQFNPTKLEFA